MGPQPARGSVCYLSNELDPSWEGKGREGKDLLYF